MVKKKKYCSLREGGHQMKNKNIGGCVLSTQPGQQKMQKCAKNYQTLKKISSLVSLTRHFTKFIFLEQLTAMLQFNKQTMWVFFCCCFSSFFFLSSHHDTTPYFICIIFVKKIYIIIYWLILTVNHQGSYFPLFFLFFIFFLFLSSSGGSNIFAPQQIL